MKGITTRRLSIVMSIYSEPLEWVTLSIDSILQQTFSDFEFIIICDNPKYDAGISLLRDYEKKDNRIKLIFNESNIGLTKSLNRALKKATGEYIARMDADDISLPDRLKKQVDYMDNNPEIIASGTGAYFFDTNGKHEIRHRSPDFKQLWTMIVFDSPIYHPSAIFRRVIDGVPVMYDEEYKYSQDYALWIKLMKNHIIGNIDEPLIKYRISDNQISASKHTEQQKFALRNQQNAVKLQKLFFSESEITILQSLTRLKDSSVNINVVENVILKYLSQIRYRKDIVYNQVASYLLLIYANYLPKSENLITAICKLVKVSFLTRSFFIYSYLSLVNKYVLKFKAYYILS